MDPKQGDMKRFVHRLFSFSHPDRWVVAERPGGSVVVGVPPALEEEGFVANFMVGIQELPEGTPLDAFITEELSKTERVLTDFEVTADDQIEIGGRPARRLSSTYRQGRYRLRLDQWVVQDGSVAVTVAASWDVENPSGLPEGMEYVIGSFTFT